MKPSKLLRPALVLLIVALTLLPATVFAAGDPPPAHGVRMTPIGNPTWAPVDFHMFSAPLGTAGTGYAEFYESMQALLPPPNHVFNASQGGVFPGAAHVPPYDQEMATGLATQGYHEGVRFSKTEFSSGNAVWVTWMNVPHPGVAGSSPDYDSGPIIPNSLFPIHVLGTSTHNGAPFSLLGEFDVPPLDAIGYDVDGHSHFPFFFADNADFGPVDAKLPGSYAWLMTLVDTSGNGWRIEAHFTVTLRPLRPLRPFCPGLCRLISSN